MPKMMPKTIARPMPIGIHQSVGMGWWKGAGVGKDAREPGGGVGANGVEGRKAEVEKSGETHHHVETEGQEDPHADLLDDEVHPELLVHELGDKQREDDNGHDEDHATRCDAASTVRAAW